jgi:2',3'-cyclic-nucleotide 2'-phosphodiesterase (5'-nucleotidase family)
MRRFLCLMGLLAIAGCTDDIAAPELDSPELHRWTRGGDGVFQLTLLHNNDGESQLIDAGVGLEDFGGIARFKTLIDELRGEGEGWFRRSHAGREHDRHLTARGVLIVSSGDNFLAGPEFNASLDNGVPFYDAIGLSMVGYDAMAIGNHEFDFGPDVLAEFIESFDLRPVPCTGRTEHWNGFESWGEWTSDIGDTEHRSTARDRWDCSRDDQSPLFLSANLDFSGEPDLRRLERAGRIAASRVVVRDGTRIGIVGATTEALPFITSPRNVVVGSVVPAVQSEIDRLTGRGVDIIILISHLQSVQEDMMLLELLHDVDIAVAGGGDEILANADDLLVPGDLPVDTYPIWATDGDGLTVPVVTTAGNYKYVGRLIATFDRRGAIVSIDEASGPVRVAGGANPDAVIPDPRVQRRVVDPVVAHVAGLGANIIATSEVPLNGVRGDVRTKETNEGDLIADALLWQADQLAVSFGQAAPDVAIQNGGGIRNDNVLPAGSVTELHTFDLAPFSNFVTIVPDISREQFKEILENAVSRIEFVDGRFAQISGFALEYDPTGTPQLLDAAGTVSQVGSRVLNIELADGTQLVVEGAVQAGDPITIATIDFLAGGGDQYPFRGAPFAKLGVTYQQALSDYIQQALSGTISASQYPLGGTGRISAR